MKFISSLLAAAILLTACTTVDKDEIDQKEDQLEVEIGPYESISFYLSVGDPLKALEAFETAYSVFLPVIQQPT